MDETPVDGADREPSDQQLEAGQDGISLLAVALNGAPWAVAVAVLAFSLFRSDPEPPGPEDPVVASPQPPTPGAGSPRDEEPAALLLASSCRTDGAGTVTCTDPGPFVERLQIRTYPTRADLYAAYVRDVEALTGGPFRGNVGDCSLSRSEGEMSWSLDRTRSRAFPLRLLRDGRLDRTTEAAGRVFCTASGGELATVIWTQDPFRLATATGSPSQRVAQWWLDAHLQLACLDKPSDCPR